MAKNNKDAKVSAEMDEIERTAAERQHRQTQYAEPAATPVALSHECDTPLEYRGEEKVPIQAGYDFVVFHPKRRVHKVPRWLADRMIERDAENWRVADAVPEYPGDEEIEDYYDIDTEEGRASLRKAFFDDPVAAYKNVTAIFWAKIDELEKEIAQLRTDKSSLQAEIAYLSGKTPPAGGKSAAKEKAPPAGGTPPPPLPIPGAERGDLTHIPADVLVRILPYADDPALLDSAMSARALNGGQQGSLRRAMTEFTDYRTVEAAETFAEKLDRFLPLDGSETIDDGGDADDDVDPTL